MANPNIKVANLAVSSYSPSIYYSKTKWLLERGYKFTHLIVFVDISDIQDEGENYQLQGDIVVSKNKVKSSEKTQWLSIIKTKIKKSLPLSHSLYIKLRIRIRNILRDPPEGGRMEVFDNPILVLRGAWTYDENASGYGVSGVKGGIEKALRSMTLLYELAEENNIKLSIGVYPWPGQLKYDIVENRQVHIWRKFCEDRCFAFIDLNPVFYEYKNRYGLDKTVSDFYIKGDVHFNEEGNKLLYEALKKVLFVIAK